MTAWSCHAKGQQQDQLAAGLNCIDGAMVTIPGKGATEGRVVTDPGK